MNEKETVCAIVPTYNKRYLLRECLESVIAQSRPPDHVLVVDNACTDGTKEMLEAEFPQVEVIRLAENQGSAGGFHEGLKRAYQLGFDWMWLMDDDAVARPEAVREFFAAIDKIRERLGRTPVLLASKVLWSDGRVHMMNFPTVFTEQTDNLFLLLELGFMPIRGASFVSIMLHRSVVGKYGYPIKEFFTWNDDVEYTHRILAESSNLGVLVPQSVAVHKSARPYRAYEVSENNIGRYFYEVRNKFWLIKSSSLRRKEKILFLLRALSSIYRFLRLNWSKSLAYWIVARGIALGIFSNPSAIKEKGAD